MLTIPTVEADAPTPPAPISPEHQFSMNLLAETIAQVSVDQMPPRPESSDAPYQEFYSFPVTLKQYDTGAHIGIPMIREVSNLVSQLEDLPHAYVQVRWVNIPSKAENPDGLIGKFVARASSVPLPSVGDLVAWNEAMGERVAHRSNVPANNAGMQQRMMFSEDIRFDSDHETAASNFLLAVRDTMDSDGAKHVHVIWYNKPHKDNLFGETGYYAACLLRPRCSDS